MLLKDRMKLLRKELRLKQREIADAIGSKVGKIKQIESGATANISFADAKLLSQKYGINDDWLRNGKGEMFLKNENINLSTINGDHNLAINGNNNNNNIILDDNTNTLNINARLKDTGKTTRENEPMAFEFYLKEVCDLLKEYGSFNLIWELRTKLLAIKALHEQQS